jgi:hypothetical protein
MKIEVNIPENLNDITLGQYQEFLKIEEPTEEDILKVFLGLDLKGLGKIKASDVDKYANHITSLSLHRCLMYLAFEKEKAEFESRMIKSKFK